MRKLFVVLCFIINCGNISAQTILSIVPYEGNDVSLELSSIGQVTFMTDSMTIQLCLDSATSSFFSLANIRKLFFFTIPEVENVDLVNLKLYPNPAHDYFTITGIDDRKSPLVIYSMSGVEMLRKKYSKEEYVDVSKFESGIYIIKVGDNVGRLIKK